MIKFSVKCAKDHVFEEWFDNGDDYEKKAKGKKIVCPECGDKHVEKTIMAPNVATGPKAAVAIPPSCGMGMGGGMGGCGGCPMAGHN
jgi:hypothetical protein